MDLKAGQLPYLVGLTRNEMGGSHFALVESLSGGAGPRVERTQAREVSRPCTGRLRGPGPRVSRLERGRVGRGRRRNGLCRWLGADRFLRPCPRDGRLPRSCSCSANQTRGSSARSGPTTPGVRDHDGWRAARLGRPRGRHRQAGNRWRDGHDRRQVGALKEAWQKPLRW